MKSLNKELWGRALDRTVPETYTTLSGEQLGKAIDVYTELVVRECLSKIENEAMQYSEPVWAFELVNDIKDHFGVEG